MYADNPISWAILLVLAVLLGIWFAQKVINELDRKEDDDKW